MSEISKWIISISGMVLVGVLIEVILPEGKMSKLLKSIIGIFSVFIIILPLKDFDFKSLSFSNVSEFVIDESFVSERESEKIILVEKEVENNLELNGYKSVSVKIVGDYSGSNLKITSVFVDIANIVLIDENLNIDIYTNIMAIIKASLNVNEECVIFYE
ncbi:MAG: hypothetical protein EOM55_03180 [Clostridia bacterium]|nr:hypothetical protein [Clostridia bacterium]